jgi:hypothetical protein
VRLVSARRMAGMASWPGPPDSGNHGWPVRSRTWTPRRERRQPAFEPSRAVVRRARSWSPSSSSGRGASRALPGSVPGSCDGGRCALRLTGRRQGPAASSDRPPAQVPTMPSAMPPVEGTPFRTTVPRRGYRCQQEERRPGPSSQVREWGPTTWSRPGQDVGPRPDPRPGGAGPTSGRSRIGKISPVHYRHATPDSYADWNQKGDRA